mmetsp:Transcript_79682/g.151323  ORF Transcript_79682/g.151323 Transcript_79682/m.151323 type:complete len:84 (-) Transcript_79682:17-268(-)
MARPLLLKTWMQPPQLLVLLFLHARVAVAGWLEFGHWLPPTQHLQRASAPVGAGAAAISVAVAVEYVHGWLAGAVVAVAAAQA